MEIGLDMAQGPDVHVESIPNDRAIWQSDTAKTYRCPFCLRPIFSQYEGEKLPIVECFPDRHVLRW